MKLFAAFLLGVVVSGSGFAQEQPAPASAVVASRQDEIARLGRAIYRVDLSDPSWTHEEVPVCPAFHDYAFARYNRRRESGQMESFMAMIPLNGGPALGKSRPWAGGIILQPIYSVRNTKTKSSAEQPGTFNLFNRLWTEEIRKSGNGVIPGLTWGDLAECYARFAGEAPMQVNGEQGGTPGIDLRGPAIRNILVELQSTGPTVRSLYIAFDDRGLIDKAKVTGSARVSW